jgi:endonuclease/exonuclease/phosphatase family metal-dependent hydrolase
MMLIRVSLLLTIIVFFDAWCGLFVKFRYMIRNPKPMLMTEGFGGGGDRNSANPTPLNETSERQIRIMSYNIQGLFPFYNIRRIVDLVRFIGDLFANNQVDVLCLQEAWEVDLLFRLYRLAQHRNLHIIHPPVDRKNRVGENSGLVVLSRFSLSYHSSFRFPVATGLDQMANKMAMYFTFAVNGAVFKVINTHLQSDNLVVSGKQLQLAINNAPTEWNERFLLIGDLNMSTIPVTTHTRNLQYPRHGGVTFPSTKEQYDFILFNNIKLPTDEVFEVWNDICLSDHYPVSIKFSISEMEIDS